MRVCFLNPGHEVGGFHGRLANWSQKAADDLGVELDIVFGKRDFRRLLRQGKAVLASPTLPDYLLMSNHRNLAVTLIPRAVAAGVKVFLINEGLLTADQATLGSPREKSPLWIGQLLPDDFRCGYLLAEYLIGEAKRRSMGDDSGKVHLCALTGDFTTASVARVSGLRAAIRKHGNVVLAGAHPAGWDQDRASAAMGTQLATHPETSVVWASSDLMAFGAIGAITGAGRVPGEDLLVGGVDWVASVPRRLASGDLAASVGGHFMDGAWALVMLHDHYHGRDFAADDGASSFVLLNRENLARYTPLFEDGQRSEINFSVFSKVENPRVEHYDFTLAG